MRLVVILALLYPERDARPNGRFPEAQVLLTVPGENPAKTLYLRTTFGVLMSQDAGTSWRLVCEAALGFSGTWDPPLAVARNGSLFVGLSDGLRTMRDGCAGTDVAALHGEVIADLTTDARGELVAGITATPNRPTRIFWIDPRTMAVQAHPAGAEGFKLETLEVAPSRPTRVYATGVPTGGGPRAHFFRGERGQKLVEVRAAWPFDALLYIAAIDPHRPERVLVRALYAEGSDVLLTNDGGATWKSVLHVPSSMFGFAKSEDGTRYFAGSGDPQDGVYRSRDSGEHWEPIAHVRVYCLHWHQPDLFACSTPYGKSAAFAAAVSHDEGATFARLTGFDDIAGPVACEGNVCAEPWTAIRPTLVPQTTEAPDAGAAAESPSTASTAGDASLHAPDASSTGEGSRGLRALAAVAVIVGALVAGFAVRRGRRSVDRR
ncbi:WD40/YVTN/BNR-like repeat-containing protein [Pendulispora albinea]|uniref:Sortilin N-terminal domain-containing protein n=1 Tax=Pendulispora albinea TaxID=2741071 RepID=A0ABZ2M602_9BACT